MYNPKNMVPVAGLPEDAVKGLTYEGPGEMWFIPNSHDYYWKNENGSVFKLNISRIIYA